MQIFRKILKWRNDIRCQRGETANGQRLKLSFEFPKNLNSESDESKEKLFACFLRRRFQILSLFSGMSMARSTCDTGPERNSTTRRNLFPSHLFSFRSMQAK